MVLVRLNKVEVCTLALREAILSVKLELSGDNRVLSPAVHVKCSLGKDEGASIRDTGITYIRDWVRDGEGRDGALTVNNLTPLGTDRKSIGTWILEKTVGGNEGTLTVGGEGIVAGEGSEVWYKGV